MKKTFDKWDKVQEAVTVAAAIVVFISITNDNYLWTKSAFSLLIVANLVLIGVRSFVENKKAFFPYIILGLAGVIFFLTVTNLILAA
ncbi:hypothetical protein [Mesobacillus subterraneus]|uniref:DUF3953 domain-containing protein n=1 Tax=Mesobacillus subterraneus TaxID=285983 RepID=A0A427TVM4_9BACI|nr:hypothetical protein [Mesobacillus subterraneus]RSD28396.1 hypothetical protein EJA10_04745 [Mesobacillus subterraneus]